MHQDYLDLGKERKLHARLVGLGAGPNYPHAADDGWPHWTKGMEDILPIMREAAKASAIMLAANSPRVLVGSPYVDRLAFAMHYEQAVNAYLKNMHSEEEFQAWAIDAHYSMGVVKVYMADSVPVWTEASEWMDPGRPYVQRIPRHHFIWDQAATRWQYADYMADRYLVAFDDVVSDSRFGSDIRKRMKELGPTHNEQIARAELWRPKRQDGNEYIPKLFLSDVFDRRAGSVKTYVVDAEMNILIDDYLAEIPWEGREEGPFHQLNLGPVPDKITPSSPAQNLELMANLANTLYRKLMRQAKAQRTLIKWPSQAHDDEINAARDAEDMAHIRSDAPTVTERIGGPDQNNFSFFLNNLTQVDRFGGNMSMRLGLGQTADTASQDNLLAQGVSRAEGYDQQLFIKAVRGVVQEIGRLLFTSNSVNMPMTRDIAPGIVVDDPWKAAVEEGSRLGEFTDYDLDVDPISMKYKSPEQKVMELDKYFGIVMQSAPVYMQQGYMPDGLYYLKEAARLNNNSCIEKLLMPMAPPPEQQGGGGHERSMVQSGPNGVYEHRSSGGGGGQSPEQQQLAGMASASADNAA